ncbi:hypothetical protein TanjilG_31461 [Lupinus angustifolius]|uniref:Drought induced 19 protein type zinc-binding domain-containing protein n=1 Tax=Lupinus angustifolius TaxID=3871 RepID=A0A4P1RU90_LUPAN|nr:PREDICTED: protein DEHYDRATION-INDUCED 19 homolog 6-like [Lupinus angustifolius]OIW18321.1 hypothetical protein TanjilG_31461 [Lupinus angustifolius]
MDLGFRRSVHSVKNLSATQPASLHSDNYPVMHYTDVDEDARSYIRCPFCDFEIVVHVPCSNLEEEHCPDLKNLVCPVCEENFGKDVIRQFTHPNSRKWMWKSDKSSFWSGNSAMLAKKLAVRGNKQGSIPDPLLSPFICNSPVLNANKIHLDEDSSSSNKDLDIPNTNRSGADAAYIGDEQDLQEKRVRAAFVQDLVLSTIF